MRGPHPIYWIIVLALIVGIVLAALLVPEFRSILILVGVIAAAIVIVWIWLNN